MSNTNTYVGYHNGKYITKGNKRNPTFYEMYMNSAFEIQDKWLSIEKDFFTPNTFNTSMDLMIAQIVKMNRTKLMKLKGRLEDPISALTPTSFFYLREFLNKRKINTENVVMLKIIDDINFVFKTLAFTLVENKTLDFSNKKKDLMDMVIEPNMDQFIISISTKDTKIDVPKKVLEAVKGIILKHQGLPKEVSRRVSHVYKEAIDSHLDKSLKVIPSNNFTVKDLNEMSTPTQQGANILLQHSLG